MVQQRERKEGQAQGQRKAQQRQRLWRLREQLQLQQLQSTAGFSHPWATETTSSHIGRDPFGHSPQQDQYNAHGDDELEREMGSSSTSTVGPGTRRWITPAEQLSLRSCCNTFELHLRGHLLRTASWHILCGYTAVEHKAHHRIPRCYIRFFQSWLQCNPHAGAQQHGLDADRGWAAMAPHLQVHRQQMACLACT